MLTNIILLSMMVITRSASDAWYCPGEFSVIPQGSPTPEPMKPSPHSPPPRPPPIPTPPVKTSVPVGSKYEGFGTYFEGFGIPYGGCGVPQSWTVDDNGMELPFIALNTFSTKAGDTPGLFKGGKNCGRWMRIVAGDNCKDGSNDLWKACIVNRHGVTTHGTMNYKPDAGSGTVLYGYVADSCADNNLWCRGDPAHIDISRRALEHLIERGLWGNRRVSWQFLSGPPTDYAINEPVSFGWAKGSYIPYFPALIVFKVRNGVSKVTVLDACGKKADAVQNGELGQMWVLPGISDFGGGKVVVDVYDITGTPYGRYSVSFPCSGTCGDPTLAPAIRLQ